MYEVFMDITLNERADTEEEYDRYLGIVKGLEDGDFTYGAVNGQITVSACIISCTEGEALTEARELLEKAGFTIAEIDVWEVNEDVETK